MSDSLWQMPTDPITLLADDIHIWKAALTQPPAIVRRLHGWCSADEQRHAAAMHFEVDQHRYIVGRGILRELLSCYTGRLPVQIRFTYGEDGKPALTMPTVMFSVSHSRDLAVYAMTRHAEIGVDVEWEHEIEEIDTIASTLFSPEEIRELNDAPSTAAKYARFFTIWTRKEAYLKALGSGLISPLTRVHISGLPSDAPRILTLSDATGQSASWFIADFDAATGYRAAVAMRGVGGPLRFYVWMPR